jgi:hypothetical protein
MNRWAHFAVLSVLLAGPDVPKTYDLRPISPLLPMVPGPTMTTAADPQPNPPSVFVSVTQTSNGTKQAALKPSSRLQIIRYVSGEFAHADKAIPGARKGYRVVVGKPIDENALKYALANTGIAVNPGDTVQITRIDFRQKEIAIDLNGGSAHHFRVRDHLQVGVGGPVGPPIASSPSSGGAQRPGATIILDYRRPLPDMSPDDLKHDLSTFLDFEREKSAAVNWVDTLPPEFKKAIQDGHAAVGMDHDMVIAALGRPDHKVREKNQDGYETEDWIYGSPPDRTVFVTFIGDKVIRVREFN